MNKDQMLHILRNPYAKNKDEIKTARLLAAKLIEKLEICPKCGCDMVNFLIQQNVQWETVRRCMTGIAHE